MAGLVGVKSQTGTNFIRPERVIAIQIAPTGGSVVVLEGGAQIHSIESTSAIAGKLKMSETTEAQRHAY